MAQKRKRSKKWISWVFILVLVITAGVVCYLVWDNYFRDKKEEGEETKVSEQFDTEKKIEKEIELDNSNVDNGEDEKKVKQYEGEDPNTKEELSGTVTYAGLMDDKMVVRVNIDQYLSNGKCELSLIRNGENVYSETVGIIGSASTSTCEGFDVSGIDIGSYDIVIKISSGDKNGTINGKVKI